MNEIGMVDTVTGSRYYLQITNARLYLVDTTDAFTPSELRFKDRTTGVVWRLIVSSGRLAIEEVA